MPLTDKEWVTMNQDPHPELRSQKSNSARPSGRVNHKTGNATQRISAEQAAAMAAASGRRRSSNSGRMSKREKIVVTVLLIIALILLIAVVITASIVFGSQNDDGRILRNVYAAGVDLGGMTEEEARQALKQATNSTYTMLDMTVQVLDTTITLSPADTGAKLDINGVVKEAMDYGRVGTRAEQQQAQNLAPYSSHTISILPYLNLDTDYIAQAVDDLGKKFSTRLANGYINIAGDAPSMNQETYDTTVTYQTLYVFVGTAEYQLDIDELYDQILEAYNINLFQVVAHCPVTAPELPDLEKYFRENCIEPIDATMDPDTYEVTKEIYGYGFDLEEAQKLLAEASYGETLQIPVHFLAPDITAELLSGDLFRDVLATYSIPMPSDTDMKANITLACKAINGTLIKAGEEFSFNQTVGQPSIGRGFREVETFLGTELTEVLGGGMSQLSSVIYYCALMSDLEILERTAHAYAPDFIDPGFDADIAWDLWDLIFRNTTDYPIRLEAEVSGGKITVRLVGTNNKDYYVKLETEVIHTWKPTTLYHVMWSTNAGGYTDGTVLVSPITGYDVVTYRNRYDAETNRLVTEEMESAVRYEKRNLVVVKTREPAQVEATDPADESSDS